VAVAAATAPKPVAAAATVAAVSTPARAMATRPDLGSLRSVRSEAYQAVEVGSRRRVASPARPRWSARPRSTT
jgi:hypothetical protein